MIDIPSETDDDDLIARLLVEVPDDLPYIDSGHTEGADVAHWLAQTSVEEETFDPETQTGDGPLPAHAAREYAPSAIASIWTYVLPRVRTAVKSGIVGNSAHTYGYHRCRNVVSSSDYSRQAPADKRGDGAAASAIDTSCGPSDMKTVTARLMNAMRPNSAGNSDPRSWPIREFFGTLTGTRVTGWNAYDIPGVNDRPRGFVTSDSSHLWHVHISIFREYVNDWNAARGIAEIMCGVKAGVLGWVNSDKPNTPTPSPGPSPGPSDNPTPPNGEELDMAGTPKDFWNWDGIPAPDESKKNPFWQPRSYLRETYRMVREIRDLLKAQAKQ